MANLNLLPDYYVKERFRYRVDMICVVLFAIVMAALIVVGKRTEREVDTVNATHDDVTAQFDKAAKSVDHFFALQGERNNLRKDMNALERLRQPVGFTYVLGVITKACPEDVSLTRIFIREPAPETGRRGNLPPRPGAAAEAPKAPELLSIEINGNAKREASIGVFVSGIEENELTQNVSWPFTTVVEVDGNVLREFKIDFEIRTDSKSIEKVRKAMEAASGEQDASEGTEDAS